MDGFSKQEQALVALGQLLKSLGYRFKTPAPLAHSQSNERAKGQAASTLAEIFGWNRPFDQTALPPEMMVLLEQADALLSEQGQRKSAIRFASLDDMVFAHSGFPTTETDAVFFGPDTYRFANGIQEAFDDGFCPASILDIGAGAGAGAFYAAARAPSHRHILLTDISPKALSFARVNAAINGIAVELRESDVTKNVPERFDLIVSNPPYMVDRDKRLYRHGGGAWGIDLSLRILQESLLRLTPQGKLVLYTGSPIVSGKDQFLEAFSADLGTKLRRYRYEEVDPDVFREELSLPPYDQADRIAAVLLVVDAKDVEV